MGSFGLILWSKYSQDCPTGQCLSNSCRYLAVFSTTQYHCPSPWQGTARERFTHFGFKLVWICNKELISSWWSWWLITLGAWSWWVFPRSPERQDQHHPSQDSSRGYLWKSAYLVLPPGISLSGKHSWRSSFFLGFLSCFLKQERRVLCRRLA